MNPRDAERIRESLELRWQERLESLQVFAQIDSTNSYLTNMPAPPPGRFRVAIAEHQTHGRGRYGRTWLSPAGSGVCLSLAYTFSRTPQNVAALTIASGIAVATNIAALGAAGVGLKWPNDIICNDAKLGGILTETRRNGAVVIAGIGINVHLATSIEKIENEIGSRRAIDLSSCLADVPSRSTLASSLLNSLFDTFVRYESNGFPAFADSWATYDWLRGRQVCVETAAGQVEGIAAGIDGAGALILQTMQGRKTVSSGSVTMSRKIGSVA
jgi:BirA family biotin operon repressor/biotin-[acetyl-CoA-carboxylase] ligase